MVLAETDLNKMLAESVSESMAQQNEEGMSYLVALKRSAEPVAAVSAIESANAVFADLEAPIKTYQGAEKRQSPRYKCEGYIEMCPVGTNVYTREAFTDISLHGCYVEAQTTYPVGTSLRVKLEAAGRTIETVGTVRVNYRLLGMGIAFVEMNEENSKQLRDLLATTSRPSVIMGSGIASSLTAHVPLQSLPAISNHAAVVQALISFFENRQMLMRDDFIRIVRQSQTTSVKP